MNIQQRLAVFYQRLRSAPAARNAEEAFALICRTLEDVENEFAPVPKQNPPPRAFDGRMYLPQSDNIGTGNDHSMWIKTRHHRITIRSDGSFAVFRELPCETLLQEFQKAGANR